MKISKKLRCRPFPKTWSGMDLIHYHIEVSQPVDSGERYLCVDFVANTSYKPQYHWHKSPGSFRLLCSKKQSDYMMLTPEGEKIKGTLSKKLGTIGLNAIYPDISKREEAILRRYTGKSTSNHQIPELRDWCDEAREKLKEQRRAARGEIEDGDYTLVPDELPEGFEQWLRDEIIANDHTLIYKKGNVRGLCYVCGNHVRTYGERFKQYNYARCPSCGTRVTAILERSAAFRADYVKNVAALQMGKDGKTLFVRAWHLCRDPEAKYENIPAHLDEFARYAIRGDKAAKWLSEYKEPYSMFNRIRCQLSHWERVNGTIVYDFPYTYYTGNLPEVTHSTRLQYADIVGYIDENKRYQNITRFILDFARYPVLEFLQKGGYTKLISQWMAGFDKEYRSGINKQGKTLRQCIKFPLRWLKLKKAEEWGIEDFYNLKWLASAVDTSRLSDTDVRLVLKESPRTEKLTPVTECVDIMKVIKYLCRQPRSGVRIADTSYSDYIAECKQLMLDLSDKQILFPTDLQAAHQRTSAQVEYKSNELKIAAFAKATEKYEKYAYTSGLLLIRPARHPNELTDEGKALNHCVGGYVDRVCSGSTAIFFIRLVDYPDSPYYTLELQGKEVIQCHTKRNRTCLEVGEPFIQAFIDEWLRKIVNRKSKAKTA